jgi:hypothetical protein
MSKLIALRLPDDLARKLETRCTMRKVSATRALLEAIERGWDEAVSPPAPTAHPPASPLSIPGVFLGSQLSRQAAPVNEAEAEPLELPMCPYTEYDGQTGETYACGLRVHSNKIRHTRGSVVSS